MQKHITEMFRDMSTINEQFIFDITANSEELSFSIFDKAKDYGSKRNEFIIFFALMKYRKIKFTFLLTFTDDLIGEAVLPVNDLCSNLNSKRVIQLHRYGQTRSGSVTAEVLYLKNYNRIIRGCQF